MPILLPTSSTKTNIAVVISGVLSVAAAATFTVPSISHFFVSSFPIVYDNTVFLVKPPYLYLVINFIIVSIVATSKLAHKSSTDSDFSEIVTPVTAVPAPSVIDTGYLNVVHVASDFTGADALSLDPATEVISDDKLTIDSEENKQTETEEKTKPSRDSPDLETEKPKSKSDSPETPMLKLTRKPPRFNHQKSLITSAEDVGGGGGNKKSALGVTKPQWRQDTMETTWKKITEGSSTPLTKHLTKSDTWQERTHAKSFNQKEKMTKSEKLNDVNAPAKKGEGTRLNREASPGQEELNRRVEAFIKKFNEEMRLQRLESLAKYNELVNGGTRL